MARKIVGILTLFVLMCNSAGAVNRPSTRIPVYLFGSWKIYKFKEVAGHARETPEKADLEIGKSLTITRTSFRHDDDFLWFGRSACKRPRYKLKVEEYFEFNGSPNRGTLSFHGLEEAAGGDERFVWVSCNTRTSYGLELAKNHELAAYYDGWFFFLRKQM